MTQQLPLDEAGAAVKRAHEELRAGLIKFYGDQYAANREFWRKLPIPREFGVSFAERLGLPPHLLELVQEYFAAMDRRDATYAEYQKR